MLPETHPLIDSITKPLADNAELKLSAVRILEQTFDRDHSSVPQAIERLEERDKKTFPTFGKILLWVLAVAGLGFAIYSDKDAIRTVIRFDDIYGYVEVESAPRPSGLTEQEQLLLGDPALDEETQKRLLFESDPTNPAYFAEYAQTHASYGNGLPPDFLETARRMDPDNAFFLYWAAGDIGSDAVERFSSSRRSGKPKPAPRYVDGVKLSPLPTEAEYKIKDQAAYEEALALIQKASELPKFESYANAMMAARARIIKVNKVSDYQAALLAAYGTSAHGILSLMKTSRIIEARAEELSKIGRKEEFIQLTAQRDALLSGWGNNKDLHLIGELVHAVVGKATATNFEAAAERLELPEMAEMYRKQKEGFIAERDLRDLKRGDHFSVDVIQRHGSMISGLMLPMLDTQVQDPPLLRDSDLKPMRMVEHEVLGRLGVLSAGLILLVTTLFIFLFRFLVPKAVRMPAKRIAGLLKLSDWVWIFSFGVILPISMFLFINRFSPVSGRDYGSSYFLFFFPGLHLSALLLTLLLAPAIVTRWRLTRRAAAFQFGSRWDLLSLPVIVVMLVYAVVAYPVLVKFHLTTMTKIGLAAPLIGWLGFVFFNGLRIILDSARSRLIQTATAVAVIPAYPLAIIALCLTLPLYHEGEKHWIVQDKLHLIDPDAVDLGAYEFKIAAQKRKETNAIMGY
jgi:hypothetical protein